MTRDEFARVRMTFKAYENALTRKVRNENIFDKASANLENLKDNLYSDNDILAAAKEIERKRRADIRAANAISTAASIARILTENGTGEIEVCLN